MGSEVSGGYGKETVVSERIDMAGFYLRRAQRCAIWLKDNPKPNDPEDRLELSILAVIWSVLALEAAANHIGEVHVPAADFSDFDRCRKGFEKPPKTSALVWKWRWLFKLGAKKDLSMDDPLLSEVERLTQLRNRLSHYSAADAMSRIYYAPTALQDNMLLLFDASVAPIRTEPSLVELFLSENPPGHYVPARQLILEWHAATGSDGKELREQFPPL